METALPILFIAIFIAIFIGIFAFVAVKKIHNRRSIEGTIESKRYEPARTVTKTRNHRRSNISRRHDHRHHGYNQMPEMDIETRTIPEKWVIVIKPSDGSSKVTREVSEQVYNELHEGDSWSDTKK